MTITAPDRGWAGRSVLVPVLVIAGAGITLDQVTKAIAVHQLRPGERTPLAGDILGLTLVHNPGAAFSLGAGATWVFTLLAVTASIAVTIFAGRVRGNRWAVPLGLILGGTVGNLIDRLTNPPSPGQGHVTDFIAYGNLFVGNIADILVVAGGILLCRPLLTNTTTSADNTQPHPAGDPAPRS